MNSSLVIIGSGPAAWTAAIYAARAELKPLVLAGEQGGGQLMLTTEVENYPGFPEGIMGPELMAGMRKQAEGQGVQIIDKDAIGLTKTGDGLTIMYGAEKNGKMGLGMEAGFPLPASRPNFSTFISKTVIIATGATANTLKLPGEEKLMGRGVGTCAVCDAPFYRGKDMVLVIGGGDSAAEEASELAKFVKKVVILVRKDIMRASAVMHNRIKGLQNIEIWYKSEIKEFLGEKRLEKVRIVREGKAEVLAVDGAFYAIGHTPATEWLKGSEVELDENGYILTPLSGTISNKTIDDGKWRIGADDRKSKIEKSNLSSTFNPLPPSSILHHPSSNNSFPTMTSVYGIFAAGDCVDWRYRQAITAAGYGCMAALDAQKWLETTLEK